MYIYIYGYIGYRYRYSYSYVDRGQSSHTILLLVFFSVQIDILRFVSMAIHIRTMQCHVGVSAHEEQPEQRRVPKANERVIRSSLYG